MPFRRRLLFPSVDCYRFLGIGGLSDFAVIVVALFGLLFSSSSSYRMHLDISSFSCCFRLSLSDKRPELAVSIDSGTLVLNLPPNMPTSLSLLETIC